MKEVGFEERAGRANKTVVLNTLVSSCRGDASGCCGGRLAARCMAKNSSRHTPRAYALARREAHAPRMGGGMRNDTARDAFRGPETKLL